MTAWLYHYILIGALHEWEADGWSYVGPARPFLGGWHSCIVRKRA